MCNLYAQNAYANMKYPSFGHFFSSILRGVLSIDRGVYLEMIKCAYTLEFVFVWNYINLIK